MNHEPETQVSVLREGLWVLRRRYYVVIAAVVLCVGASWFLVRSQPKMYRATTRLLIEPRQSRFGRAETSGSSGAAYYYFYRYELQTQIMTIKSNPVAQRVVDELNLQNEGPFAARGKARDQTEGELLPKLDIAPMVAAMTSAEPVGETRFIDISFEATDPEWSAKIANAIAMAYLAETSHHRRKLIKEALKAYADQVPEQFRKLKEAEAELIAFQEKWFVVASERPAEAMRVQELNLRAARDQAKLERIAAQARLRALGADSDEADSAGMVDAIASDDPWIRELLDTRLSQVSLLNDLRRSFSDGHPKLESAKSRLETIEAELARAVRSYNERLKRSHQTAIWKEQETEKLLKELKARITEESKKLGDYNSLRQKRDSFKKLLDPLSRSSAELDLAAQIDLAGATVTREATEPRGASRPNKIKYIFIGIVMGLALGGWLAYAIDGLDETIRSPENLKRAAPIHVLGTISLMSRKILRSNHGRAFTGDPATSFVLAEEFRSLRTGLLTAAPWRKEDRSGVVLVTSPGLGEGKTTVSVNGAEAVAQLGKPVVLVDADIRRSRLHEMLECPRAPGLVDVLEGKVALKDAIKPTSQPNLFILPAGMESDGPAEILASDKVRDLVDELKKTYGLVWIDSPPVMLVADARTLVPLADLVIVVARSTVTRRREFERAYELVASAAGIGENPEAANKLVAVVNGAPESVAKQSGYYHSAYGRYYRSSNQPRPAETNAADDGASSNS